MKKIFTSIVMLVSVLTAFGQASATLVLEQNFDAFSNGSVAEPGTVDITGYSSTIEHRLASILTGWSGSKVYEAGGALLIKDGGNISTTYLKTSTDDACARLTLDIKCMDSYGGGITVTAGYSTVGTVTVTDGEWHTIQVYYTGSSSQKVKIQPYFSASGVIIDNMKVETSAAFISAPTVYQPTTASKTRFVASWKKVTGATGYLLNVYSKNGETREYLKQDESVTTNSVTVDGLDAAKKYYFTVKTVKGEYSSAESEEIEVVPVYASIDAPVATEATNVTAEGFTANWNAVEIADKYTVIVNKLETLSEAKTVTILSEDFSGVKEGSLSSVTIPAVSREYLDAFTKNAGWYAVADCYAAGYMGIYPLTTGSITTPALNLSGDGGKFSLDIKIASNAYGTFKDDACKINIYQGSSETPVKTIDVATTASGFASLHYDLDCGVAQTWIEVEYSGSNKLFIDDVVVKQDLKAGDVVTSKVAEEVTTELSKSFALPFSEGVKYEYAVYASVRTVVSGDIDELYSVASNTVTVANGASTGIKTAKVATTTAKAVKMIENGKVVIKRNGKTYNVGGGER